jgi:hypothetical protein
MTRILLALVAVALSAPAAAEENAAARYTMTPINGGVLRLDTLTGAVARCVETAGAWSCRALPDDALALQDEIDRLAEENARLRAGGTASDDAGSAGEPVVSFRLPSDAEVDRAMGLVERVLKRFKSIVDTLREDEPGTAL